MLMNELGDQFANEQAVFPFFSFNRTRETFTGLGTGFLINPLGWFVTAKHIFFDNKDKLFDNIFGIQSLSNLDRVIREVTHVTVHSVADIIVGKLGVARSPSAKDVDIEPTQFFTLSFKKLFLNDRMLGFGYSDVTKECVGTLETFKIKGTWSSGVIDQFLPKGRGFNKHRCYITSMNTESGQSGGPVFNNNHVVGVISTGMGTFEENNRPYTVITPIDYLLDFSLPLHDDKRQDTIPTGVLIKLGHIKAVY